MLPCCCSAIHLLIDSQLSRPARSKISFMVEGTPELVLPVSDKRCWLAWVYIGSAEDKLLIAWKWKINKKINSAEVIGSFRNQKQERTCRKWFFKILPSGWGKGGITCALSGAIILLASKSISQISSGNLWTYTFFNWKACNINYVGT